MDNERAKVVGTLRVPFSVLRHPTASIRDLSLGYNEGLAGAEYMRGLKRTLTKFAKRCMNPHDSSLPHQFPTPK